MIFEGCQGKASLVKLEDKICPSCGNSVEMLSTDATAVCDNCGTVLYNDTFHCILYCEKARECVGDEVYEHMTESLKNIENADEDEW